MMVWGMDALVTGYRMLWEHERYYCFSMVALLIGRTGNPNVILVWAWMLWLSYALGTQTLFWFGHGCSGYRMHWENERYCDLRMDVLVIGCMGTRTSLWFAHGCFGHRMHSEHERYYGLGHGCPGYRMHLEHGR